MAVDYLTINSLTQYPLKDGTELAAHPIPQDWFLDIVFSTYNTFVKRVYINHIFTSGANLIVVFKDVDTDLTLISASFPFSAIPTTHLGNTSSSFVSASNSNCSVKLVLGPGMAQAIQSSFNYSYTVAQGELSPSAIMLAPAKVKHLIFQTFLPDFDPSQSLWTIKTYGPNEEALLAMGNNIAFANPSNALAIDLGAGLGLGLFDPCATGDITNVLKINNSSPDSSGNFFIKLDDCYAVRPLKHSDKYVGDVISVLNPTFDPEYTEFALPFQSPSTYDAASVNHSLVFENKCSPKCPPENLNAYAEYLNRVVNGVEEIVDFIFHAADIQGTATVSGGGTTLTGTSFTGAERFEKYASEGRNVYVTYSPTDIRTAKIVSVVSNSQVILDTALPTGTGLTFRADTLGFFYKLNNEIARYNTESSQFNVPYGSVIFSTTDGLNSDGTYGTFVTLVVGVFNPSISTITYSVTMTPDSGSTLVDGSVRTRINEVISYGVTTGSLGCKEYGMTQASFFIPCGGSSTTIHVEVMDTTTTPTEIVGLPVDVVANSAPCKSTVTSSLTATASVGTPFCYQITATNSPTAFAVADLPAWATFDGTVGAACNISGTPTETYNTHYTIPLTITNAGGDSFATLQLSVVAAPVITSSLATVHITEHAFFVYTIIATNLPTSYNAHINGFGSLPAGLSIDTSSGIISGRPTVTGTFDIVLTASNAVGTTTQHKSFVIAASTGIPVIDNTNLTPYAINEGDPFTFTIGIYSGSPTSYGATGLPTGLTINTSTGVISGTVNTPGIYLISVTASDGTNTGIYTQSGGLAQFTLTVHDLPDITSDTTAVLIAISHPYSYQISAVSQTAITSYNASGLPTGLTVNTSTGLVSGTPTVAGSFTASISATNGFGTTSVNKTFNVSNGTPIITSSTSDVIFFQGVAVTPYTITATNTPTSFAALNLPAGLTCNNTTGVISGTPTNTTSITASLFAFNVDGSGSANKNYVWGGVPTITSAADKNIFATVASSYTLTATGNGTITFAVTLADLPSYLTFDGVNTISGTPPSGTPVGTFLVHFTATNPGGTVNGTVAYHVLDAPVFTTTTTAVNGYLTSPFTLTVNATNSPTYAVTSSIPPGLSFNTTTGALFGTPTSAGSYPMTFTATNGAGTATLNKTVNIYAAPTAFSSSLSTVTKYAGDVWSYTIVADNAPTSYNAAPLPSGTHLNSVLGTINGTISSSAISASFNVVLTATNPAGSYSANLPFVLIGKPVITPVSPQTWYVGVAVSLTLTADVVVTSWAWTGPHPSWISLNTSTGVLSGTPTAGDIVNDYSFSLSATNPAGTSALFSFNGSVVGAPEIQNAASSVFAYATVPFTYDIIATGNPTSFSLNGTGGGVFTITRVVDPITGVITGRISGTSTDTSPITYTLDVTATNPAGTSTHLLKPIVIIVYAPVITNPIDGATLPSTMVWGGFVNTYDCTGNYFPESWTIDSVSTGLTGVSITELITGGFDTHQGEITFNIPTSVPYNQSHWIRFHATNPIGDSSIVKLNFYLNGGVVSITPPTPPTAYLLEPFSTFVSTTGHPTAFSATGLPIGLSIDNTGGVSGTVDIHATVGVNTVNLTVTNPYGNATASFNITVALPTPDIIAASTTLLNSSGVAISLDPPTHTYPLVTTATEIGPIASGTDGVSTGTTSFTSASASFGFITGKQLVIQGDPTVYTITAVPNATTLTLDSAVTTGTSLHYEVIELLYTYNNGVQYYLPANFVVQMQPGWNHSSLTTAWTIVSADLATDHTTSVTSWMSITGLGYPILQGVVPTGGSTNKVMRLGVQANNAADTGNIAYFYLPYVG